MNNRKLLEELARRECRDATFHRTEDPVVIHRALGALVWDVEDREYLDLCAGFGALPIGHNHPRIIEKLVARITSPRPSLVQGLGDVCPSLDKVELLSLLMKLLPQCLERASLAVTGSQAVETAMKTAMLATKGTGFIAFSHAYHGVDLGTLPVSGLDFFSRPFGTWGRPGTVDHLALRAPMTVINAAIDRQAAAGISTAAIIVEPVQGRGGVQAAPLEWLLDLSHLCRTKGILLILDEVFTGLGRLGRWTMADEVSADLVCLGKALGGGMPLSACVGTRSAMDAWPESRGEALHTGTFFGHPLASFFGLETLRVMVEANTLAGVEGLGTHFLARLREALGGCDKVKDIRGIGLMMAVEFTEPGAGDKVMGALRNLGVLAIPAGPAGECLSITPPLNISIEQIDLAASKIALAARCL